MTDQTRSISILGYGWLGMPLAQGLEVPRFEGRKEEKFKIINSEKLKDRLNYRFLHPDPMQSL